MTLVIKLGQVMDEELPFISSSPLLDTAPPQPKTQDELDLPALQRIRSMLTAQIDLCNSIDTLDLSESEFKVKQQVYLNRRLADRLREVQLIVDTVIKDIKEKYE